MIPYNQMKPGKQPISAIYREWVGGQYLTQSRVAYTFLNLALLIYGDLSKYVQKNGIGNTEQNISPM